MSMPATYDDAVSRSDTVADLVMSPGAIDRSGEVFLSNFSGRSACLIADELGWSACGPMVEAQLQGAGISTRRHVIPSRPRPKPTVALANSFRDVLATDACVPVAVGSGVINDLVKHASFDLDRRYLCIATAASMDGYTSAGSPLSDNGFKMTIPCRPPLAVIGDLDVIADAPAEMMGWGYGDLAGKVPAGADWILADSLGVEPIDETSWQMVQGDLRDWLFGVEKIAAGDRKAIEGLFAGLALVGLAMEAHGSSRPASGADHQIAHLWEMDNLMHKGERVSHGACVSIGCLAVLQLYDWLLQQDLEALDIDRVVADAPSLEAKSVAISEAFPQADIASRALIETTAKHLSPQAHRERLELLNRIWPQLKAKLSDQLLTPNAMASLLAIAGAPVKAADIGVSLDYLQRTTLAAKFLRSRYTVLDLLDETGLLDQAVEAMVTKGLL